MYSKIKSSADPITVFLKFQLQQSLKFSVPKILYTKSDSPVGEETYRWIFRLHGKIVEVVVWLLLLDWTLNSRLAAIFDGNGERDGNAGDDTMNHGLTRLARHSWKSLRSCALDTLCSHNISGIFTPLTTAERHVDAVGLSFLELAWLSDTGTDVNGGHFARSGAWNKTEVFI